MDVPGYSGVIDGVRYELENGLLNLDFADEASATLVYPIVEALRSLSRSRLGKENLSESDILYVHRAMRMAWEAMSHRRISSIDKDEADVLYTAKMNSGVDWIFHILNPVMSSLQSANVSPSDADSCMKSVYVVMST
jgi:hypothetical protein